MKNHFILLLLFFFTTTVLAQKPGTSTPVGSIPWSVTSINPSYGATGTLVEIKGMGFNGVSAVRFGGTSATSFTAYGDTMIKAVVGTGASGEITITTPFGIPFPFPPPPTFTYVSSSTFPVITSIGITTGGQGDLVAIDGKNFTSNCKVFFGGTQAASYQFISSNSLIAIVGPGSSGNVAVAAGNDTAFYPGFIFNNKPVINTVLPNTGKTGDTVTINGRHLSSGITPSVNFGGIAASKVIVITDSIIKAIVGNGASGNTSVTTNYGTGTYAGFIYKSAPVITSFTPATSPGGSNIFIKGKYFLGTTAVSFGGVAAAYFTLTSDSTITAVAGAGASGNVAVTNAYGTGVLGGFIYTNCNLSTSVRDTAICAAQLPFNWGGAYRYSSGTYRDTLHAANGCDSIATINLMVIASPSSLTNITVCRSALPFQWNGMSLVSPGAYSATFTKPGGCDSTAHLNLTIAKTGPDTTKVSICQSALPYIWHGTSYPNFGIYTLTLASTYGCDSTAILILSQGVYNKDTLHTTICYKLLPYTWRNKTYTSTGLYADTIKTALNCDSIAYLQLTVEGVIPAPEPFNNEIIYAQYDISQSLRVLFPDEMMGTFVWYTGSNPEPSFTAPTPSTAVPGTYQYYAALRGAACESPKMLITVIVNPYTSALIDTVNFCPGNDHVFNAGLTGASYMWEVYKGNDSGFVPVTGNIPDIYSGENSKTMVLASIPSSFAGYQFRCRVDNNFTKTTTLIYSTTRIINDGNTNWSNAASWSCGKVPDAYTDVIILTGTVIINTDVTIRSLKLSPQANLIISPGVKLTITH